MHNRHEVSGTGVPLTSWPFCALFWLVTETSGSRELIVTFANYTEGNITMKTPFFSAILAILALFTGAAAFAGAQITTNRPAPELVGGPWLNTPKSKPATLASLKGKVVVLHFWTFG